MPFVLFNALLQKVINYFQLNKDIKLYLLVSSSTIDQVSSVNEAIELIEIIIEAMTY